jgi:hypothetical protein
VIFKSAASTAKIVGWVTSALGTVFWLYGYFWSATPPLIDWSAIAPSWIADYLASLQSEIGMALMLAAMVPLSLPARPSDAPDVDHCTENGSRIIENSGSAIWPNKKQ